MEKLEPPVKRYLAGRRPTHSSTQKLHENYVGLDHQTISFILSKYGCMTSEGKPTKKALESGLIEVCEKSLIWNLDAVTSLLQNSGLKPERRSVNQEKPEKKFDEPELVNLGTIGMYFSKSNVQIGKWLDELGLRDEKTKLGTDSAQKMGLCQISEMATGQGKKTRKITVWDLHLVIDLLMENGYELDYSYEQNMKGKGKNSDVSVVTMESRTQDFLKEFSRRFKSDNFDVKKSAVKFVLATPKPILKKAEEMLNKPGFFINNEYQKWIV